MFSFQKVSYLHKNYFVFSILIKKFYVLACLFLNLIKIIYKNCLHTEFFNTKFKFLYCLPT